MKKLFKYVLIFSWMEIIRVRLIGDKDFLGCEAAPIEILKYFREINCKEDGNLIEKNKLRFEEIHVNLDNKEESDYLIFENSKEAFARNSKTFFIGGDNSINYSILRAFRKIEKNPLSIIFDSHTGVSYSDYINKNWLKRLIDDGYNSRSIILVGSRSFDESEKEFLVSNKIFSISMDLLQEDIEGICDLLMERARDSSGFFTSIDLDFIDPSCAPGVNIIEPGGLNTRDFIYIIKRLKRLDNFKGISILGVNPSKDINSMTSKLGAKILSEAI